MRESTLGVVLRGFGGSAASSHPLTTWRRVALSVVVLLGPITVFVFEPAHLIMQRGMMSGVRDRAEAMMGGPEGGR